MAKGSAMGLWRGKKGSTVFYYNRNSNNSQKQAMRERVYEISNPRTSAQAGQRMKLAPAQRVANALNAIIKRSWQGVEYGGKGRSEFMKRALSMTSGWPFVPADDDRAVPGEYQISRGSIPEVLVTAAEDPDTIISSLQYMSNDNATIGTLSEELITYNGLKQGDQITIVVVTTNATGEEEVLTAGYIWRYGSFIIDTSDTKQLDDWCYENIQGCKIDSTPLTPYGGETLVISADGRPVLGAAAIIVSRLNGTTYERSTSRLAVGSAMAPWFAAGQKAIARRSYEKKDAAASVNWPVDPDEGDIPSSAVDGTYTLSGLTGAKASANGQAVRVKVDEETSQPVAVYVKAEEAGVIGTGPFLVKPNGNAVTYTEQSQEYGITPSDVTALASLPQIPLT